MKNEIFSILSEKVLPYKIKSIIWHKKIDIIVVLCDNYYEIHRIGFKHEDIFQKEESCNIKHITFLEDTETISVLLENSFMYLFSCSNCETIVQKKLNSLEVKKTTISFQSYIGEGFTENNERIDKKELLSKNPFYLGLHFNSFSKIDISTLTFFHNYFEFNFTYLYDKPKNKVEIFLYNFINIATIPLSYQAVYSKCLFNHNLLLLLEDENMNLRFSLVNLKGLFKNTTLVTVFFYLSYSINILDYLNNITDIFQRLIYKIGIIFFDKFIFSNKLENIVCSENEEEYKKQLKEELKYLFYTGIMKTNLYTFLKSDLFEGKTMIKMDENIFFNLRNLEDIYVENIKASLSVLSYYINEIKLVYISSKDNINNSFQQIESWFNQLTSKYENLINQMSTIKLDYRSFLAWLNTFNTSNPNENKNNYLHSVQIDEEKIWNFIEEESYNMSNLIKELEPANEKKTKEVSYFENPDSKQVKILSTLLNDDWTKSYFSSNNFDFKDYFKSSDKTEKNMLTNDNIKEIIIKIKDSLEKVNHSLKDISKDYTTTNEIIMLKGYDMNKIRKIKTFKDELSSYISFFYTSLVNNKECEILFLLKMIFVQDNEKTKSVGIYQSVVNFSYETTKIIDYDFQNKSILLLVKSQQNINSNYTEKFSIIQSFLSNYNFKSIFSNEEGKNSSSSIDLQEVIQNSFNDKEVNDVIIDKYIDIDCSDNSYISCGQRGLFTVVDNRLNKLTIFDIYNN